MRLHAKAAMIATLSEVRVARASATRVQTNKAFSVGDLVDMFRRPLLKDAPGWRGPGVLLDICESTGTAIVKWQGKPWLVNKRFIRPHVGLSALFAAGGASFAIAARRHAADKSSTNVHLVLSGGSYLIGSTRSPLTVTGLQMLVSLSRAQQCRSQKKQQRGPSAT